MHPLVMGVLNVTPDSFSDGGRFCDHELAVAHGLQMVADGADVVDVGGESSRPGAKPVPEGEELRRVVPVVEELAKVVRVSIDTVKPAVAEQAVEAGATLINDISANLWPVAANAGAGWVAMHMRGRPADMQENPRYENVVEEVEGYLLDRAQAASVGGVQEVWLDPGIGFGKTTDHNLSLLAALGRLCGHGLPVMIGTSRKSFLGDLGAKTAGRRLGVENRGPASLASATFAMMQGASMVRVHDVAPTVQAATLVAGPRTTKEGK